jgi:hypothetical protein
MRRLVSLRRFIEDSADEELDALFVDTDDVVELEDTESESEEE